MNESMEEIRPVYLSGWMHAEGPLCARTACPRLPAQCQPQCQLLQVPASGNSVLIALQMRRSCLGDLCSGTNLSGCSTDCRPHDWLRRSPRLGGSGLCCFCPPVEGFSLSAVFAVLRGGNGRLSFRADRICCATWRWLTSPVAWTRDSLGKGSWRPLLLWWLDDVRRRSSDY